MFKLLDAGGEEDVSEAVEGEFIEEIAGEVDFEGALEVEDSLFDGAGAHVGDFFHQVIEGYRLFCYGGCHCVPCRFWIGPNNVDINGSAICCSNFERCVHLSDTG